MEVKKGGRQNATAKEQQDKLLSLKFFDRDHKVYVHIEQEIAKLSPAKAFDLFCHYCAKRNPKCYRYPIERTQALVKEGLNRISVYSKTDEFEELSKLSEKLFLQYTDIFLRDYMEVFLKEAERISIDNNFSFNITTTILLETILPFYSDERLEVIYEHLYIEHRNKDKEFANIIDNSTDKHSLIELYIFFIKQSMKIDFTDIVDTLDSPFYLSQDERFPLMDMLYRERYRPIEYKIDENLISSTGMATNYQPNVNLQLNMDKSFDYNIELLTALYPLWNKFNEDFISKDSESQLDLQRTLKQKENLLSLRSEIMAVNKNKTLAGKLVDILYVYDMKYFKFTNTTIQEQLTTYWKNHPSKLWKRNTQTSLSTVYNYHKLSQNMIDTQNYKRM